MSRGAERVIGELLQFIDEGGARGKDRELEQKRIEASGIAYSTANYILHRYGSNRLIPGPVTNRRDMSSLSAGVVTRLETPRIPMSVENGSRTGEIHLEEHIDPDTNFHPRNGLLDLIFNGGGRGRIVLFSIRQDRVISPPEGELKSFTRFRDLTGVLKFMTRHYQRQSTQPRQAANS